MISWPASLKPTAIRKEWFAKISRLPGGLDLHKAARMLREPYGAVRRWGVIFGYEFPDRRRAVSRESWEKIDWGKRDAQIARELGVTRECVRLVRKARGMGPSAAQAATRNLERFIAAHCDKLHGLLVEEVIHHSGTGLPYHVVRRLMRDKSIRPHEAQSPLRDIDWRLPNRDLAILWSTSSRYIANLRARLGTGSASWNARDGELKRNRTYANALSSEKQKASRNRKRRRRPSLRQAVLV
ncbi:MAG TPA: hypothetical protein VIM11_24415 [Tepidisphaeraceae bacterium]|jgi:hypothetical protein